MAGEQWLTIGEAAEILGMNEQSVRRRADAGDLGKIWWTQPGGKGQRRLSADGVQAYRRRLHGESDEAAQ